MSGAQFAAAGAPSEPFSAEVEFGGTTVHTRTGDEFYLIWTKHGRNPRYSHVTLEEAQKEVRRLAARHPDRRWFILKAVERAWVNEAPDRVLITEGEVSAERHVELAESGQ